MVPVELKSSGYTKIGLKVETSYGQGNGKLASQGKELDRALVDVEGAEGLAVLVVPDKEAGIAKSRAENRAHTQAMELIGVS